MRIVVHFLFSIYNITMLYLASSSPRRQQILTWLEVPFRQLEVNFDEDDYKKNHGGNLDSEELVTHLAYEKAKLAGQKAGQGVILTADTDVFLDNQVLGKPKNLNQAKKMIKTLSGREHQVITAVCLMEAETGHHRIELETSVVEFFDLTGAVITSYLKKAGDKILDKAGAYAIQMKESQNLIAGWRGSLSNIIGLPLAKTAELIEDFGFVIDKDIRQLALDKLGVND